MRCHTVHWLRLRMHLVLLRPLPEAAVATTGARPHQLARQRGRPPRQARRRWAHPTAVAGRVALPNQEVVRRHHCHPEGARPLCRPTGRHAASEDSRFRRSRMRRTAPPGRAGRRRHHVDGACPTACARDDFRWRLPCLPSTRSPPHTQRFTLSRRCAGAARSAPGEATEAATRREGRALAAARSCLVGCLLATVRLPGALRGRGPACMPLSVTRAIAHTLRAPRPAAHAPDQPLPRAFPLPPAAAPRDPLCPVALRLARPHRLRPHSRWLCAHRTRDTAA